MADYLTYWKYETAAREEGKVLNHSASEQYAKLVPGDILWFVTYEGRTLFLIGRMEVEDVVDEKEAMRRLRNYNLWEATYHVLAREDSASQVVRIDIMAIASKLRFISEIDRLPRNFTAQSVRSMRRLTDESVDLLREALSTGIKAVDYAPTISISGQGFVPDYMFRKNIEDYAVECATDYFQSAGYEVDNKSSNSPYDLLCRKFDGQIYVEVKGTTTHGDRVILTAGEVRFAQSHKEQMVLFIMHSVVLEKRNNDVLVSGGHQRIIQPWDIEQGTLVATQYVYTPG
jgi:hypothetical protein